MNWHIFLSALSHFAWSLIYFRYIHTESRHEMGLLVKERSMMEWIKNYIGKRKEEILETTPSLYISIAAVETYCLYVLFLARRNVYCLPLWNRYWTREFFNIKNLLRIHKHTWHSVCLHNVLFKNFLWFMDAHKKLFLLFLNL